MYKEIAQTSTSLLHTTCATILHAADMESAAIKLKALREAVEPKITVREMAEAVGFGHVHSRYAYFEDPKRFKREHLPLDLARRIANVFELRNLDPTPVLALAGITASEAGAPSMPDLDRTLADMGLAVVPELDLSYSMGGGSVFEDAKQVGIVPFRLEWLRNITRAPLAELFVARGEGDSMQPTLLDGDIVLVDASHNQIDRQDRIWAVSYGDLIMIKRVRRVPGGRYQLLSDNPAISPIDCADGEMHVVGRVAWIGRKV